MKPVAIDEFCNFSFPSSEEFSPDGKTIVFVLTSPNKEANKYESNLYMKRGSKITQLTSGGKEGSFKFLDKKTVLFMGNREESKEPSLNSILYKISLDGGEAKKTLTFPIPVNNFIPLKNGDYILEGNTFPGFEDLYLGDKKLAAKYLAEQKENADYQVITRNPWWWNGATYTKGAYGSLYYYFKKTKKIKRLTDVGFDAVSAKLTEDEKYIFFLGKEVDAKDEFEKYGFYRLELATGEIKNIVKGDKKLYTFDFQFGKDFIVFAGVNPTHGMNTNPDFYKIDYKTLEVVPYAKWGEAIGSSVGSDVRYGGGMVSKMVGNTYYFTATIFDACYLYKLEEGEITKVIDKEGSIDSFDIYEDKMIINALWDMKGPELYDENIKQVTKFNDKVLKNKYVAMPEPLIAHVDGRDIHGFVLKPFEYDEKKKYPVIFDIHGGPKTVYGQVYYHEMQYWAGKGYFVVFCNPTGSDGRGNDFMDIRGKYGTVDFEDLMGFLDCCLKKYGAMDEDRLFETGGSYGGFMTNWIIGHTDRFKACASQRSISNWTSFYGVSDIGIGFSKDQNAADPWNNYEKLWWHSPLKYANNVKTPTLFLHSEEDYRCPIDQGYQMYTALVDFGVETRLIQFKGENHDLSRTGKPKHRIRRLEEITGWFEKHDVTGE